MARAPCETNELMRVVFDDKREVGWLVRTENPLPLILTNRHGRSATVGLTEGLDVQCSQQCYVACRRFTQVKRHLLAPTAAGPKGPALLDGRDLLIEIRRRDDAVVEVAEIEPLVRRVRVLIGQADAE